MPFFLKYSTLFLTGGGIYGAIEFIFRGSSHWTMVIAGGICFLFLYGISKLNTPRVFKYLAGGIVITAVEFLFGGVFNLLLGWNIWDYSAHWLNISGQICPLFSAFWVLLSIPAISLCRVMDSVIFHKMGW